jgi:hypothetical protein
VSRIGEGTSPGVRLDGIPEQVDLDVTQPIAIEFNRDGVLLYVRTVPQRRARATKLTLELDRTILAMAGASAAVLSEKVAALGGVVKVIDGELVAETEPHVAAEREALVAKWIGGDL